MTFDFFFSKNTFFFSLTLLYISTMNQAYENNQHCLASKNDKSHSLKKCQINSTRRTRNIKYTVIKAIQLLSMLQCWKF